MPRPIEFALSRNSTIEQHQNQVHIVDKLTGRIYVVTFLGHDPAERLIDRIRKVREHLSMEKDDDHD